MEACDLGLAGGIQAGFGVRGWALVWRAARWSVDRRTATMLCEEIPWTAENSELSEG